MSAPALRLVEAPIQIWIPSTASNRAWAELSARSPQLTATMRRYLVQLSTFLAPHSVEVADGTLRQLARWLTTHTDVTVAPGSPAPTSRTTSCGSPPSPATSQRRWPPTPNVTDCGPSKSFSND